jgi:hypothetical protein
MASENNNNTYPTVVRHLDMATLEQERQHLILMVSSYLVGIESTSARIAQVTLSHAGDQQ